MLTAAAWGFFAGLALLVGALTALVAKVPLRAVGLVMGFGSGVLVSAVAFELTAEAITEGGPAVTALALIAGGLVFVLGDWELANRGAHRRKSPVHGGTHPPGAAVAAATPAGLALALVLGSVLDGIPESAAIGVSLLDGGGVGVAFVAAVFLSNLPEGLAATSGLRAAGRSPGRILTMWLVVALASALAAALGYGLLAHGGPVALGAIQAFAGGAVLAMLANSMLPEAVEHGGRLVGLAAVLGFAAAVLLRSL